MYNTKSPSFLVNITEKNGRELENILMCLFASFCVIGLELMMVYGRA